MEASVFQTKSEYIIPGLWPVFISCSNVYYKHILGGEHYIQGATSPNSNNPLLRLMSIDRRDPHINKINFSSTCIPLFFSWNCSIANGFFTYQVRNDSEISILDYEKGCDCIDKTYPNAFPGRKFILRVLTTYEQKSLTEINCKQIDSGELRKTRPDLDRPMHQIGGEPYLVQPLAQINCPICNEDMPFLATVSNESICSIPFTTNDYAQAVFHICQDCNVITAYAIAD